MKKALALAALVLGCSSSAGGGESNAGGAGGEVSTGGANATGGGGTGTAGVTSTSGGGGTSVGGSGGTGLVGSAGASGSAGSSPTSALHGQVNFVEYLDPIYQSLVASFSDGKAASTGPSCDVLTMGSCTSYICDPAPASNAPAANAPSAGTITFTSTDVTGSASVSPDASGAYGTPTIQFPTAFVGREHGLFQASGGAVPAFSQEVDVPLLLLLSQPATTGSAQVSRASDLVLTWTRGAADVFFSVIAGGARVDGKPGTASLSCQFPSEPGAGTISSALLQRLKTGETLKPVTVHEVQSKAGAYDLLLGVTVDVRTADKSASVEFVLN